MLGVLAIALTRLLGPQDRFKAFSLPYVQDFTDVDVKRWFSESGVWTIRNETLAQMTNLDEPAQIFVPQKLTSDQVYHLSTYISLSDQNAGGGRQFQCPVSEARRTDAPGVYCAQAGKSRRARPHGRRYGIGGRLY